MRQAAEFGKFIDDDAQVGRGDSAAGLWGIDASESAWIVTLAVVDGAGSTLCRPTAISLRLVPGVEITRNANA
jgi:hypothetical protein